MVITVLTVYADVRRNAVGTTMGLTPSCPRGVVSGENRTPTGKAPDDRPVGNGRVSNPARV